MAIKGYVIRKMAHHTRPNCFTLQHPDSKKRQFFLQAESEEDMFVWLEQLDKAVNEAAQNPELKTDEYYAVLNLNREDNPDVSKVRSRDEERKKKKRTCGRGFWAAFRWRRRVSCLAYLVRPLTTTNAQRAMHTTGPSRPSPRRRV